MTRARHRVVALGGEPSPGALVGWLLGLVGPQAPRALVPVPDAEDAITRALAERGRVVREAALGEPVDVVYVPAVDPDPVVAGWRESGVADRIVKASQAGTLVAGAAGGAVALFSCGIAGDGLQPRLAHGIGLVAASLCPRHDSDAASGFYHGLLSRLVVPAGVGLDTGAAAAFVDGRLTDVVADRAGAHAYHLSHVAGEVILKASWAQRLP